MRTIETAEKMLDLDTHVDLAHTAGIVTGDGAGQEYVNIVDLLDRKLIEVTSTETSSASPMRSLVKTVELPGIVNYIGFGCSARGNQVIASVMGDIAFVSIGGVYYPVGDYSVPAAGGTVLHRIPTKRNYTVNIGIFPSPYASGYSDAVRLLYGYLPDERETVLR